MRNNNLVLSRETLLTQVWGGTVRWPPATTSTTPFRFCASVLFARRGRYYRHPAAAGFMFTATELKTTDSLAEMLMVQNAAPVGKAVLCRACGPIDALLNTLCWAGCCWLWE
ncbi:helix-turn-helix domain-containing protein [Serratia ureilytica]